MKLINEEVVRITLLVTIALLVVIITDCNNENEFFSYRSINLLKGFAACLILFHHFAQRIGNDGVLLYVGYLAVGLFYSISGFCIHQKWKEDNYYLIKIIKKKIPSLIISCVFVISISIVFYNCLGSSVSLDEVKLAVFGNRLNNWYFFSSIVLYIIFCICRYTFKNDKIFLFAVFIFITFLIVIYYILGLGIHWYVSTYCLLVGLIMSVYVECIVKYLEMHYIKSAMITFTCFIITFLLGNYILERNISLLITLVALCNQMFAAMFFSLLAFLLFYKKRSKNILNNLGTNSANMIYFQNLALDIPRSEKLYITSDWLYIIVSIMILYVLIVVFRNLIKKIRF